MKIIYMALTLGLLHQIDPKSAQEILEKGEVKETEESIKYVLINEEI